MATMGAFGLDNYNAGVRLSIHSKRDCTPSAGAGCSLVAVARGGYLFASFGCYTNSVLTNFYQTIMIYALVTGDYKVVVFKVLLAL